MYNWSGAALTHAPHTGHHPAPLLHLPTQLEDPATVTAGLAHDDSAQTPHVEGDQRPHAAAEAVTGMALSFSIQSTTSMPKVSGQARRPPCLQRSPFMGQIRIHALHQRPTWAAPQQERTNSLLGLPAPTRMPKQKPSP